MQRKPFHPWSLMANVKPEAVAGRTRGRPGSPASVCAPGIAPSRWMQDCDHDDMPVIMLQHGAERSWECKYGPYAADSEWLDYVGGPGPVRWSHGDGGQGLARDWCPARKRKPQNQSHRKVTSANNHWARERAGPSDETAAPTIPASESQETSSRGPSDCPADPRKLGEGAGVISSC